MLRISAKAASEIRLQGARSYPHECCGALLGRDGAAREVLDVVPLANRREDSPRNRFSITPEDVREAERHGRQRGLELLGWYHSHPDHPARPSDYDREHAWPWYSYVIVGVEKGTPGAMTSWRLGDDRSQFRAEELELAAGA